MEGCKLLAHHGRIWYPPKLKGERKRYLKVVGVMARPSNEIGTAYSDTWFDRIAIQHLSKSVQATTGIKNNKEGYESLIEAATVVSRNHPTSRQQQIVLEALSKAFPNPILTLIRTLLPPSKFTREYFALFTTFFFGWLIGPCKVKESELEGRRERNVVHINKCRFLEGTNCVGMCANLCKIPSQKFIKDSFGIPLTMVPRLNSVMILMELQDFEDMSCEMIFGQEPPETTEDPVMKQPCYKICKYKRKHKDCASL